jgi:hypothetical protein
MGETRESFASKIETNPSISAQLSNSSPNNPEAASWQEGESLAALRAKDKPCGAGVMLDDRARLAGVPYG